MTQCDTLFSRILVPVDGSRFSMKAVELANRIAMIHHAEVRLIHVVDSVVMDQLCRFSREPHEKIHANMERSGKAFLEDMAGRLGRGGVRVSTVLREGTPHEVILRESEDWGADLIVIGKLGKRGVSRILLGSVAERIVEFAGVPVLVAGE